MEINVLKSKFLRGMFDQNTYVLTTKNQAVIIDSGAELEDVERVVGDKKVLAVLMTHLHFDHFWNLDEYLKKYGCSVYIQKNAEEKFSSSEHNGAVLIRRDFVKSIDKCFIKYYSSKIKLGEFDIDVFETAGHSSDSVCLLICYNLFTGDTVFADSVGRTDLYDSSNEKMTESLKLIRSLNFKVAYPGHYESADKNRILKTISFYL